MNIPKGIILCHVRGASHAVLMDEPKYGFDGHLIEIRKYFEVNGADVPRLFRPFMSPYAGDHLVASSLHDALYAAQHFSRRYTDQLYRRMLIEIWTEKYRRTADAMEAMDASRWLRPIASLGARLLRTSAPWLAHAGAYTVYWFLSSLGWIRWSAYTDDIIALSKKQVVLTVDRA